MKTTVTDFAHRFVGGSTTRTLLLLHGTGGNEHDLLPLGKALDPEANLLSPRGKILEHGMPRFFRRLAEGVFDQEDLRFRTRELGDWIEWAKDEYSLDPQPLTATGYSNGANIAASLLLTRPETLGRKSILFRAMTPFEPERLPDLSGKEVLMLSGRLDPIIPPANSARLAQMLEQAGAKVDLRWADTGHGLTQAEVEAASQWLLTSSIG